MYESPSGNRRFGGRRWRSQQPPLQAQLGSGQNPNFAFQKPNYYLQEPNFLLHQHLLLQNQSFPFQNPGFPIQNPCFPTQSTGQSLPPHKLPHQRSEVPGSSKNRNELLEKVDSAVARARCKIIEAGESVTSWKVSQEALLMLKVDSWNSLGFAMQEVPNLHRLILTEGKINAFIHCFIGVRRITSLYDLQVEICKNEGVEQFEELELGPFLRQPLILHYFSVKSNVTEVHKITSEEIISFLWKFLRKMKHKKIEIEDFMDFIAKRRPVAGKEELGIRVQSLGMHISAIRKGMQLECGTIQKSLKKLKLDSDKKYSKSPRFSLEKKQLDERFSSISQRVESFSSIKKDFWGKHTRFASSSSDDETSVDFTSEDERIDSATGTHFNLPSQDVKSSDRMSSCPYPSEIEEMTRLGLKGEMPGHSHPTNGSLCNEKNGSSKKKRKSEKRSSTISATSGSSRKKRKNENFGCIISGSSESCRRFTAELDVPAVDNSDETGIANYINRADLLGSDDSLRMFITTWKEACCKHTASEVFERMLQCYDTNNRQRKKIRLMFSSLPFAGLLNIAVSSIKSGMWDSMYETFQALRQQKLTQTHMEKDSEYTIIDVEPSVQDVPGMAEDGLEGTRGVSVEEIMQKVSIHLLPDYEIKSNTKSVLERRITLLRKLYNCEYWLAKQFSVKTFKSLGHGEFLMFLEEHASMLPDEVNKFLIGDMYEKSPLEVHMTQHQLAVLVSQALNVLQENETMTKEMISLLLMRQFPLVSLKISENGSMKDLLDMVGKHMRNIVSKGVLFSATLFEMHYDGGALPYNKNGLLETTKVRSDISQETVPDKSITSRDAIEVLLRAPMMSDLNLWAHWDLIFAPSLGPLVPWLLSEVNMKELLCLVTKDGKVLRIDFSATVDSFLEAALLGSPFQTALQLLSLFSLLGGEKYVPLSLLKCHARHAFEVILKNSLESMDVKDVWKSPMLGDSRLKVVDEGAACNFSSELHISLYKTNKAVPVVSRFVLDCLGFLPQEFRCFAADILLSAMRVLIKDAASAIMCECNQSEERLMLHEVGLSLGIVEWIDDYHAFCSTDATDMLTSGSLCLKTVRPEKGIGPKNKHDALPKSSTPEVNIHEPVVADGCDGECTIVGQSAERLEVLDDRVSCSSMQHLSETDECKNATLVIESIRRDEFGLDPNLPSTESSMLKKQHARLGRALHCLSQELYSQDSHFLLELVQNADDNDYPAKVEPTLTFILQESGIVVLNNERGFSAQNIRALCDVGNSTKKGSNAGYIGQKGIGFKSVFRVTDAPEIHSNGFHVKFDISEGQIGFVLPTIVPPCDIGLFSRLASSDTGELDSKCWNTCIVLPFRSRLSGAAAMNSILPMFSDLHPSLLLFLHRLKCIKFRNLLNNTFIVMRKEIMGDGIVKVSHGKEKMTWFVASQELQADVIHRSVGTTEISIAFTLQESTEGDYIPLLDQHPVFAFLPLRTYGLKFILQGDFVLPSSREEVDGNSPWNQWLLSEFPNLFVGVERSFCALSCFRENPGKAVSAFMSFVPLVGEVHGFFSSLPRLIISKLRMSNCLLLDGGNDRWAPPCKILRGWNEEARSLLPDALLCQHLGLGFLDRNIKVSDSLARALGIQEYGAPILVQFMSSLSHVENGIKSMGLSWLSSWLNALYKMSFHSSGKIFSYSDTETDLIMSLQKISFIPLSDGTYSSVDEGTIWLQSDMMSTGLDIEHGPEAFPNLFTKLRTVCPALLSASIVDTSIADMSLIDNITKMLHRIGVQRLSAHEIMKLHILPAVCDDRIINGDKNLMAEYLCFVMIHLKLSCVDCRVERQFIISELRNKAFILTNHGFKRPVEVSIHFSQEYGNPVDVKRLINIVDARWHEVDSIYLRHPVTVSVSCGVLKWREFLQEIGITDFVQIIQVNKTVSEISPTILRSLMQERDLITPESIVKDWESLELVHLMSLLSKNGMRQSCIYLLEVFDLLWDGCFSERATGYCIPKSGGEYKPFKSSFMGSICDVQWVACSMDDELHYPKDLFYDCDSVRSILGASAPYAVPKMKNGKLVGDIGLKTKVTIDDVWEILKAWKRSKTPFRASLSQMSKLYTFIWNEMATSKQKILEELHSEPFIFVPHASVSRLGDEVPGIFLSPEQVCWHDSTGSLEKICSECTLTEVTLSPLNKMLSNIYPSLHDFFIDACGVPQTPPLCSYLQILLQLSTVSLPSQAANAVFQVFLKWSDGLISGLLRPEDVTYLKECLMKLEFKVLPTEQDKWVSLHSSFGLVCWCDDKKLRKQFKNFDDINFLHLGELSEDEAQMLKTKVSVLLHTFGIPALSEVVIREAIYYGLADCSFKTSLLGWALPYAQRYLCSVHPDKYIQLKQSKFDILNRLQVIVVEELYYRNVIKGGGGASKKRIECSCLLQGNILYTTRESDSHAIYMELSHLLFDGTPDLHLANFLHMITTMAESGSTMEQIEFFILNSQKMPRLPDEESVWSCSSIPPSTKNDDSVQTRGDSKTVDENSYSKSKNKAGSNSSWPPAGWKTAPGFSYARANGFKTQPITSQFSSSPQTEKDHNYEGTVAQSDDVFPISVDDDWTIGDNSTALVFSDYENLENLSGHAYNRTDCGVDIEIDPVDLDIMSNGPKLGPSQFCKRDQLRTGTPNAILAAQTGRLGELVAFKYITEKFGKTVAKWVNEDSETGLPYDIVVGEEISQEYIEVKATKSRRKDWFNISTREWQFAVDKGDLFSIAHVVLLGNNVARVSLFKNPLKLCQQGKLQLVCMLPMQQTESSIAS